MLKRGNEKINLLFHFFIQNEKEGIEFFLAATILVNQNQIFNDDLYEYDTVGIPFLAALGEAIYTYELKEKD